MAWEARSGLKRDMDKAWMNIITGRLNGLGSPFGIETVVVITMTTTNRGQHECCLLLLIETVVVITMTTTCAGLNGLGSPFGIETHSGRDSLFDRLVG